MPVINPYITTLDPIVVAWLAQLTTSFGSNPSTSYITALDTMIKGMRTDGDLTLLDRFWIFAQEVQGYSTISIVNPASTAITEVNTPTWTANQGYTFDGATTYLNTNYNLASSAVNFTQNNSSHGIYTRSNLTENKSLGGMYPSAAIETMIWCKWNDLKIYGSLNSVTESAATEADVTGAGLTTASNGLHAMNRTVSTTQTEWLRGVQIKSTAATSVALASGNYYIGASNVSASPAYYSTRQLSMAFLGGAINQNAMYSRFETFRTTIGF